MYVVKNPATLQFGWQYDTGYKNGTPYPHQTHSTITRAVQALSLPMFAMVLKLEKSLQACKGLMTSERVGSQLFMVGISGGLANVGLSISTCQTSLHSRLDLTWMAEHRWHTERGRFICKIAHPNPHRPQHFGMIYRVEGRQAASFSMFSFHGC